MKAPEILRQYATLHRDHAQHDLHALRLDHLHLPRRDLRPPSPPRGSPGSSGTPIDSAVVLGQNSVSDRHHQKTSQVVHALQFKYGETLV